MAESDPMDKIMPFAIGAVLLSAGIIAVIIWMTL
jgi:hypothetical protein